MRVKSDYKHIGGKGYIERLASEGRYCFTSQQARIAMGGSFDSVKLALNRLRHQGHIATPARGFYVIVPPEYRSLGCLPAEQFIPALMAARQQTYYAGLLSAAQYYGAAHQRPQQFQVFLAKKRRSIRCGKVRVNFVARKRIEEVPTREFNTARGTIRVSTPEATAIDLVGYPEHAGGFDHVATILAELADVIEPGLLPSVAATAPLPWAQRLGFLLEFVNAAEAAGPLKDYVKENAREFTPLIPGSGSDDAERVKDWKVIVNAQIETDL